MITMKRGIQMEVAQDATALDRNDVLVKIKQSIDGFNTTTFRPSIFTNQPHSQIGKSHFGVKGEKEQMTEPAMKLGMRPPSMSVGTMPTR